MATTAATPNLERDRPHALPRPHLPAARSRRRGWLLRRMLLLADVTGLAVATFGTSALARAHVGGFIDAGDEVLVLLLMLPLWLVVARFHGLYRRDEERPGHSTVDDIVGVFETVAVCAWVYFAAGVYLTGFTRLRATELLVFLAVFAATAVVGVTAARVGARALSRRHAAYLQKTVIVGAGDVGQLVARKLLQHPEYGVDLVGFVDGDPKAVRDDLAHVPVLGPSGRLASLVERHQVERVIVAFSKDSPERTIEVIRSLHGRGVQIDVVPRLYEAVGPRVVVHRVEDLPLLGLQTAPPSSLARTAKRAIDVAGALVGLLVAAPLFAYAAWRIRRESPGPVFFRQTRLGHGMREFTMLKFRTMKADTDHDAHRAYIKQVMDVRALPNGNGIYKLDRHDAVTPFGRWLRKCSLDELPQLINVLRGEMSLVGPRPCIPYETESFEPHHFERFLVPAGITGLWQVTARGHATFREALDMDAAYARGWTLGLDLSLLLRTPLQLVRPGGTA